eukprot:TRINITY_DN18252_c0_g1_i1.p1 TRINITY_DN18252_c0_g1~~TRINITY_DN18252_c0_g1_i1.p1  ORF type:complete len:287 (-),score=41.71 TRINITY_DN18252_c0_g1_i1:49-816(-)
MASRSTSSTLPEAGNEAHAGRPYWCHKCDKSFVHRGDEAEVMCPICGDDFVEETSEEVFDDVSTASGPGSTRGGVPARPPLSPHVNNLFDQVNSMMQSLFEGPPLGPPRQPANITTMFQHILGPFFGQPMDVHGSMGDYFLGPGAGLENLISQLMERDPNRFGPPPASKVAVTNLVERTVTQTEAESGAECAVCKEGFPSGQSVREMPCHHFFHAECLLQWLKRHNSCPVCRYELPTDDPDYEVRRQQSPFPHSH